MTPLEITLIVIIWVGYGIFAIKQTEELYKDADDGGPIALGMCTAYIIFAPLVFIAKAVYGALKKYRK